MNMKPGLTCTLLALCALLAPAGVPAAGTGNGHIEHIVLCWLREPTPENRRRVIEASRELAAIAGVRELHAGPPLPGERDVVDDSFDVGISMSFASRDDMETYLRHEEHVRRLEQVFLPLCGDVRIHDFRY